MISRTFCEQGHSHAEIIPVIGQARTRILCASMEAVLKKDIKMLEVEKCGKEPHGLMFYVHG